MVPILAFLRTLLAEAGPRYSSQPLLCLLVTKDCADSRTVCSPLDPSCLHYHPGCGVGCSVSMLAPCSCHRSIATRMRVSEQEGPGRETVTTVLPGDQYLQNQGKFLLAHSSGDSSSRLCRYITLALLCRLYIRAETCVRVNAHPNARNQRGR
jgi:hypothetical protein